MWRGAGVRVVREVWEVLWRSLFPSLSRPPRATPVLWTFVWASELERMLETDLVFFIASVEVLRSDFTQGRSDLSSSLQARLPAVSHEIDAKVATSAESWCAVSDKIDSQFASRAESCEHPSALVAKLDAQVSDCFADLASLAASSSQRSPSCVSGCIVYLVMCLRGSSIVSLSVSCPNVSWSLRTPLK